MSLIYSDTTTKNGIIQVCERNCGFNDGEISGKATLLAQFTGLCNMALDDATAIIFESSGTWQYDDTNHADYPIIVTDLVSGQRDYSFVEDESGNLILDIFRVFVKDANGTYIEIYSVDQQSDEETQSFSDGQELQGTPYRYDKTGNGIFLDPVPNYDSTGGLKILINRESSYFATSDTTKKPGIDGLCHEYIPLKASYTYARDKSLPQVARLERDVMLAEQKLRKRYGRRQRDVQESLSPTDVCSI